MTILPCNCPTENPECLRSGFPMVGQFWELCANKCPPERPCHDKASEQCRQEWDRRAAAKAAGKDPLQPLSKPRLLGDHIHAALDRINVTPELVQEWFGDCCCEENRQKLNALDLWARQAATTTVANAKAYLWGVLGVKP